MKEPIIKHTECQWIGQGERCNNKVVDGRSYCEDHIWLVYQQGTALRKRHKDIRVADTIRTWESLVNEAVEELENEGVL